MAITEEIGLADVAVGIAIIPMLILLDRMGRPDLIYPVLGSFMAIAVAVRIFWPLRTQVWFRVAVGIIILIRAALIASVHWRAGWIAAPIVLVFSIGDFGLIYLVIRTLERGNRGEAR